LYQSEAIAGLVWRELCRLAVWTGQRWYQRED